MRSESGQGIVEYILVLVIAVGLILGLLYQFDDAFRVYAQNYFGDYLACLLETGELPNLGSTNSQGTCGALFQPFDINNGQGLAGGGGAGGAGVGSTSQTNGRGQNEANSGGSAGGTLTRAGGGSNGGSGAGSNGSSFSIGIGQSGGGGTAGQKAALYTGSDESSIPSSALSGRGTTQTTRQRFLDESFIVERRPAAVDSGNVRIPVRAKDVAGATKNDRIQVKRKIASRGEFGKEDEAWTFGTYLRILIIAAIVIALLLLIGGQALQISQGMES